MNFVKIDEYSNLDEICESKTFYELASKLKKKYSKSPNIEVNCYINDDGIWKLYIHDTEKDIVLLHLWNHTHFI